MRGWVQNSEVAKKVCGFPSHPWPIHPVFVLCGAEEGMVDNGSAQLTCSCPHVEGFAFRSIVRGLNSAVILSEALPNQP